MLHRFLGLSPPVDQGRKRQSDEDRKASNKIYDVSKRKRSIVPSWKTEFAWLVTDDNSGTLYCQTCRAAYAPLVKQPAPRYSQSNSTRFTKYAKGPFVTGCTNLRHDALVTHQCSEGHKHADNYMKAKSATPGDSIADKTVQSLNKSVFNKLDKMFRSVHGLAKHSRPLTDLVWQSTLDEKKGVEIGKTYLNKESAKEFLVAIAEVEKKKIEQELAETNYCTIMSDGTTDVSVIETEIVYMHYAKHGASHCKFLGLIGCQSATAESIYDAIFEALKFDNLSKEDIMKKIVGFAGDGASVNTGKFNGVIAHMRRNINPAIVMVTCMTHRIELAFKDAMKGAVLFSKVFSLLDELYKFYHRSPKQLSGLKSTCDSNNFAYAMPTRVGGTRWVGHTLTALHAVLKGYTGFRTHLEQVSSVRSQSSVQSKAKYLCGLLKSRDVITFTHFLADVVTVLAQLSKTLQKRETCLYEVHQQLQLTITNIQKLKNRPGPHLREVVEVDSFQGQLLQGSITQHEKQMPNVLTAIVEKLQKRFSDMDEGVLLSTKIVDLKSWPACLDDATDFGDELLASIVDHYKGILQQSGVNIGLVEVEWTTLKYDLYNNHKVHDLSWEIVNNIYGGKAANILQVVDLILSLPAGSAECERGFSQLKLTKTQYRNRLKPSSVTLLMTVQLHSAAIEDFNPEPAIHYWNLNKRRRPSFLSRSNRTVETVPEEAPPNEALAVYSEDNNNECDSDYDSDFSDLMEDDFIDA